MAIPFLNNIIVDDAGHIQFKTTAGANAGKIDQDGNNLVISNAVGDILLGDGSADVHIGDGTNTVDIRFEQNMAIFADSSSTRTLTLGGANTSVVIESPTISGTLSLGATTINNKLTFTTGSGYIVFDYEPSTGDNAEYTSEVPLLKVDHAGTEKTILSRLTNNGALAIGIDDTVAIVAGDTKSVIKDNHNYAAENIVFASEGGFIAYGFPNNDTSWSNRNVFKFNASDTTASNNGLYIGDGGQTQFIDLNRNLKNIGTITASGAVTANQLNLDSIGDYITFYGGGETNHSITSRQLDGGTGDDIRVNTYGSFIINLDSNDNQSTAANSSFFVGRHGSNASAIGASDLLFQIDGQTGHALPGVDATQNLGNSSFRWGALELKSGGQIQWQNGDARIIEGDTNNYSLSFQTYNSSTSSLTTALRLDGNNDATFNGDITIVNHNGSNPTDAGSLYFNEAGTTWASDMYGFRINQEGSSNLLQFQSVYGDENVNTILTLNRDTKEAIFSGHIKLSSNSHVMSARKFTARDGNGVMLTADDASSGLTIADNGNATFSGSVTATSLDINGDGDFSGNLNITGNITNANWQGDVIGVAKGGTGVTANTTWLNANSFANFASSSADWDTITTRGSYRLTGSTNNPFSSAHSTGIVITQGSGDYGIQLFSSASTDNGTGIAYRYRGTSWQDWQYLVTKTYGDGRYGKIASPTFTGTPAAPTASAGTNTTQLATTAFVTTAVSNLVDSAPGTLNTLNELAAALGDDASFSTTTATALGNRVRVDTASQGLSDTQKSNARTNIGAQVAGSYLTSFDITTQTDPKYLRSDTADTASGKIVLEGNSAAWDTTTPGLTTGSLHFDPGVGTDHFGNAITFGASDSSNGTTAQAGIYLRTDGSYGSRMYFATTDSYASGSKVAMYINQNKDVYFLDNINVAGDIIVTGTVDGVDILARDGVLTSTTTTANAALPKAGGTMTGDLTITHASTPRINIIDTTNDVDFRIRAANSYVYIEADNDNDADSTRIQFKVDDVLVHEYLPSSQIAHENLTIRKTHATSKAVLDLSTRKDHTGSGNFTAGDDIGAINFRARDSVVTSDLSVGQLIVEADNTFTSTDKKTRMKAQIYTGSSLDTVLFLDSDKSATFYGNISTSGTITSGNITATGSGNTALSVISTDGYSQLITQASDDDSAYVFFKDTSGERARLYSSTSNDLIFKTNGGGTTALTLDNSGNAAFEGGVTITHADGLFVKHPTNGGVAQIKFSDAATGSYDQVGHIKYAHGNSASYGSNESFVIGGTETTMTILADGKLMYNEGIYSKPGSGTGAGTRKDQNWDTAYGWGNHASAGYLTAHPSISAASSSDNSGRTYIQDITLDSNGHVTGITTATETVTNTNTQLSDSEVIDAIKESVNLSQSDRTTIRSNIGAGTSSLQLGTTSSTALAGNTNTITSAQEQKLGYITVTQGVNLDTIETNSTLGATAFGYGNHADEGYLTSLPSHNHDDRYYTETEIDGFGFLTETSTQSKYLRSDTADTAGGNITFSDDVELRLGSSAEFRMEHNSSGNTIFRNYKEGGTVYFQSENSSGTNQNCIIWGGSGSSVELRYNNANRLLTTTNGVELNGAVTLNNKLELSYTSTSGSQFEQPSTSVATYRVHSDRFRIWMGNGSNETFTVTEGGRIGINDSSPDYTLDVSGNVSNISIYASHDVAAYSDARVKTDIETIPNALDKVNKLRGVTFVRTDEGSTDKRMMGVIAQEVKDILPEVVNQRESDGHYSVSYGNMVGVLIEAVKELTAEVEELKKCGKCDNCNCKNK